MNIILVSHCNFYGNSAMHVFSIAEQLKSIGHDVVMLIPDSLETMKTHRVPNFQVLLYDQGLNSEAKFKDGNGPQLIHCWTPREHVRIVTEKLVEIYQCPFILHMEDNEEQIVTDELNELSFEDIGNLPIAYQDAIIDPYRSHPIRYKRFAENAAGYTCLIDRLLEFKPLNLPGAVFWAGYDPEFESLPKNRKKYREKLGIAVDETIVFYSGNVHYSIVDDVRKLYLAVAKLRDGGTKIRLLRTGWDYAKIDILEDENVKSSVIEMGFVDRADMPSLLGCSDLLIQPGRSDPFNDYRFPSKLPEYLVSGKPVVLPACNIGNELTEGKHVLKLKDGSLSEIVDNISALLDDKNLAKNLGVESRKFALDNLSWKKSAQVVSSFYETVLNSRSSVNKQSNIKRRTKNLAKARSSANTSAIKEEKAAQSPVRTVAFYLPQFHPIPENDLWWGKGFTEWTNVTRAKKQLYGHRQPRIPTELGYYDLRVTETMHEQAKLAQSYGVSGFCFYVYWFEGRRLLERPVDLWIEKGPDFPFCICWANENWSRRWDGSEDDKLMTQDYSEGFEERFIRDMLPALTDPRYIKIDGALLLPIYRVSEFPNPSQSATEFRNAAEKFGLPKLHLTIVQSFGLGDPRPYGFDAAIEFSPPHVNRLLLDPTKIGGTEATFEGYVEDYVAVAASSINAPPTDYTRYRGCFPMWDNTARRSNRGHIFVNDSPKAYANWLRFLTHEAMVRRKQVEPIIFINAWNEWAEGTYLEPDEHHGRTYLNITKDALIKGVCDFAKGRNDLHQEKVFTNRVSMLPKYFKN